MKITCFLCDSLRIEQYLELIDPATLYSEKVGICSHCYHVSCQSNDQHVAHVWKGLRESQSAGYTDGGFVNMLWRRYSGVGGLACLLYVATPGFDDPVPHLAIAIHVPFTQTNERIFCRSRGHAFPALVSAAEKIFPAFNTTRDWPWVDKQWFVAEVIPSQMILKPQRNMATATALVQAVRLGREGDLFSDLAEEGSPAGYEIIRRWLL